MKNILLFVSRLFLGSIFVYSGVIKIIDSQGELGYMRMFNIPATGVLLIAAISLELIAGVFFIFGLRTRYVGIVLVLFLAITTYIFHSNFSDPSQQVHFLKNLAILGGLLYVTVNEPA